MGWTTRVRLDSDFSFRHQVQTGYGVQPAPYFCLWVDQPDPSRPSRHKVWNMRYLLQQVETLPYLTGKMVMCWFLLANMSIFWSHLKDNKTVPLLWKHVTCRSVANKTRPEMKANKIQIVTICGYWSKGHAVDKGTKSYSVWLCMRILYQIKCEDSFTSKELRLPCYFKVRRN
jgi:hypothetical protein